MPASEQLTSPEAGVTEATLSSNPARGRVAANLSCMAAMMVWAIGFPLVSVLLPVMSPLALTAGRMAIAALSMLPIWLLLEGPQTLRHAPWGRGILIGAFGFGTGAYLLVEAQSLTDGVTVAIMSAMMPVVGIGLECLLDGRRLTPGLIAGLGLSLLGGLLTCAGGLGQVHIGLGAGAVLLSILFYCWASRETVKGLTSLSPLGRTALTLAGSSLSTGAAYGISTFWHGSGIDSAHFGPREVVYLGLYGCGSLAVSQILWIVGVARLGVGLAAMHINAAPFYVMLLVAAGGGGWNGMQVAGALVVGLGVIIAQGLLSRA